MLPFTNKTTDTSSFPSRQVFLVGVFWRKRCQQFSITIVFQQDWIYLCTYYLFLEQRNSAEGAHQTFFFSISVFSPKFLSPNYSCSFHSHLLLLLYFILRVFFQMFYSMIHFVHLQSFCNIRFFQIKSVSILIFILHVLIYI